MSIYISTRNKNSRFESHAAVIQGLAPDGGLFVPETIKPFLNLCRLQNLSYEETAFEILSAFMDDYSSENLKACIHSAYKDSFDTDKIAPTVSFGSNALLELWHGPTCAFKDIALTLLPHLMRTACSMDYIDDTIAILTATSGDTGKAAISGFSNVPNTSITVFYPEDGVSDIQKRQMQTSVGNNVNVVSVQGNFDDCQRMVKEACSSHEVLESLDHVRISSANSINTGRLLPQIVYYVTSYMDMVRMKKISIGDPVNFSVPTGNFGDILAGYIAKLIGLPIKRLICASNSNHVLTDFINTGIYSIDRQFLSTMSPSMDILISSNLERLLFLMSGRNESLVQKCMQSLHDKGSYAVPDHLKQTIQCLFSGYWANEEQCAQEIRSTYENDHILIDPHTAVGAYAMHAYQDETSDHTPCIVLSTASPYKFAKDVYRSLSGIEISDSFEAIEQLHAHTGIAIPKPISSIQNMPIRFNESIAVNDGIPYLCKYLKEVRHD